MPETASSKPSYIKTILHGMDLLLLYVVLGLIQLTLTSRLALPFNPVLLYLPTYGIPLGIYVKRLLSRDEDPGTWMALTILIFGLLDIAMRFGY